ncbi:FAD-dependent monooxygenase mdpD [Pseudocercospora fuligena]|uniref:FAD-dependent monooxygenase mdpD n=1 Tax=Pseudocercospora fuligena TaxID=685502 RepID=A0A8H6RX51_9PEZI|nr:FAD-dependent monooxygenase mdpD [Pseudocercospora fuligena]
MTADVRRRPSNGTSVLISGAGVGGLMAALELWRKGCDVRILERTKTNHTQGDSFNIGQTAIDGLRHWPELQKRNEEIAYNPLIAYCNHRGERLAGPFDPSSVFSEHAAKREKPLRMYRHSRPKFHAMLLEQLSKVGIEVEYGNEVVDYFEEAETSKAGIIVKDGLRYTADLVVAADGVRSQSWSLVAGQPVPARKSGDAILRTSYPVELALADPIIAERFPLTEEGRTVIELWTGPDMHVAMWRNEDEMQYAIHRPDPGTSEESWSHKVRPEEALAFTSTIEGWPEVGNRVIKATPPDLLVDWKLMWREPQPISVSPGGRVVQIGDAAHTFLPSSGNGGTQAIEDAISLAACLTAAGSKENIPDAARVHQLLRFERVSCLQAFGVANLEARNTKKNGGDNSKARVRFGKWIIDHDPENYANEKYESALAHLKTGAPFKNTNIPPGMEYVPWTIDGLIPAHERGEKTVLDGDWD